MPIALMGSNMQRQAVPLLVTEGTLVATGLEGKVAQDSRAVLLTESAGVVASVTGSQIVVLRMAPYQKVRRSKHDPSNGVYVYRLRKFMRSNAATCINQKALVQKGQKVKAGEPIADGHPLKMENLPWVRMCSAPSCHGMVTTLKMLF